MGEDDRLQRLMEDPETYMAEARQRAREMVERDLQRDLQRRRREFWRRARAQWQFHIHWWRYDGWDVLRGEIYHCRCGRTEYGASR